MNKITNIVITDKISFNVTTTLSMVNTKDFILTADDSFNYRNIFSDQKEDHSFCFDYTNSIITAREIIVDGDPKENTAIYTYEVIVESQEILKLSQHMKYFKLYHTSKRYANDYSDGLFYDPYPVFLATMNRIRYFTDYNMKDDEMQYIMLVTFKKQLMGEAIDLQDGMNALMFYNDLVDLLEITERSTDYFINYCNLDSDYEKGQ